MRYKIYFQYEEEAFGFEGEQYTCICERTRHFKNFNNYQDFLQQIDMAGDETTKILSEEEITDFDSNLYIFKAAMIFLTAGWFSDKRINKFYDLLNKSLVDYFNMPLARWMDQQAYHWHNRKETPVYINSHRNDDFIGYFQKRNDAIKCWLMYLIYDHEITRIEKVYRDKEGGNENG